MTRYSKTMSEALEEVKEASARADARRAMSKDKDMKQNPFSKDDDATDDDVKAASKNIIMQLRKSVTMKGNHAVEFSDGKKKIDPKFAQAAMDKFMRIRRPDDKLKFQNKLAKSYKDLLKALKEKYEMVEVKEDYVCEDCGCPQGNADPNCSCPNDSTDLQASYWVKKESVDEGFELEEGMKMNDPKLLKMFDKLKKGSKIKLKTSSTISQGKDYVEYIVKSKNTVNKGRVEKITLATVGNEKAVKKFLYKRDGTVGFAIGDMGASIDDIKEGTWAVPSSSKAKAELKKLMSKPIKLGKEGDDASDIMYSLIGDDELFDDLYVAGKKNPNGDARPVIKKAMKRLGIKEDFTPHMMYDPKTGKGYKADKEADHLRMKDMGYTHEKPDVKEAKFSNDMIDKLRKAYEPLKGKKIPPNPLMKIFDKIDSNKDGLIQLYKADIPFVSMMAMSRLMLKHNMKADDINKLGKIRREDFVIDEAVISPQYKEGMKAAKDKKPYDSNPYTSGKKKLDWAKGHNEYRAKKLNAQYEAKSATGYEIFHKDFSSAMQHATSFAKSKGQPIKKDEIDNKVATGPKKPSKGKENSYTLETEKGKRWSVQVYNMGNKFELNMYLTSSHVPEGDMLDEMREPYAVVDTADGNKVVGTASDEKGAKSIISTSQLPPMKIKDKKTLKIVKVKKKQMIGQPIKEEEGPDNRPDSAKDVDQGRDDKKKTRIAQLQLQIAKATETINKLNAQEK